MMHGNQPFIAVAEPEIGKEELAYVTDAVESGWVSSLGKYIPMFEESFAEFCGSRFGVASSNGTTALHLALLAVGVGPGDEVIVPTLTFVATANAVTYTGARPVFVDSEPVTWNLDPSLIEAKITSKTKAIIPVHLYGHPAEMDSILEIAHRHRLFVIEDAAEAHGATYKDQRVGSLGHIGCFSFYGNKMVTTGEGGMSVTDDEALAEKMRDLRDHGMSKQRRYWHPIIGYNYRMTNIQAALGVAQMERIDSMIARKRCIARWYNASLGKIQGITLPPEEPWGETVYWLYSVLIEDGFGVGRDEVMARLKAVGIDSRPFFYPMHVLPPYYFNEQQFPVAEALSRKGISLPSGVTLREDQIERICSEIYHIRADTK